MLEQKILPGNYCTIKVEFFKENIKDPMGHINTQTWKV